jgi:hypothetical protein
MNKSFIQVGEAFKVLKTRFQSGDISRQEFIDEMKKLRIRDDQGRFWMIGAQTGKWYFFDGKDWVPAAPPSQKDHKAICIYCGFENALETDVCARCGGDLGEGPSKCPRCGAKLERPFWNCPNCPPDLDEKEKAEKTANLDLDKLGDETGVYSLRSIQPLSLFLFGGVLGLILGVIFGAFSGATDSFSAFLGFLPQSLFNLQTTLLGAAIFAFFGGLIGFAGFGIFAAAIALAVNLVLSLTGGIRFGIRPQLIRTRAEKRSKAGS